jgi:hypothetical protein
MSTLTNASSSGGALLTASAARCSLPPSDAWIRASSPLSSASLAGAAAARGAGGAGPGGAGPGSAGLAAWGLAAALQELARTQVAPLGLVRELAGGQALPVRWAGALAQALALEAAQGLGLGQGQGLERGWGWGLGPGGGRVGGGGGGGGGWARGGGGGGGWGLALSKASVLELEHGLEPTLALGPARSLALAALGLVQMLAALAPEGLRFRRRRCPEVARGRSSQQQRPPDEVEGSGLRGDGTQGRQGRQDIRCAAGRAASRQGCRCRCTRAPPPACQGVAETPWSCKSRGLPTSSFSPAAVSGG